MDKEGREGSSTHMIDWHATKTSIDQTLRSERSLWERLRVGVASHTQSLSSVVCIMRCAYLPDTAQQGHRAGGGWFERESGTLYSTYVGYICSRW